MREEDWLEITKDELLQIPVWVWKDLTDERNDAWHVEVCMYQHDPQLAKQRGSCEGWLLSSRTANEFYAFLKLGEYEARREGSYVWEHYEMPDLIEKVKAFVSRENVPSFDFTPPVPTSYKGGYTVPKAKVKAWVYVLTNPLFDMIKIGMTTRTPEKRAAELSSTSVPRDFAVAYKHGCKDKQESQELEQAAHSQLSIYRVNKDREFFECSVDRAVRAIKFLAVDAACEAEKSLLAKSLK